MEVHENDAHIGHTSALFKRSFGNFGEIQPATLRERGKMQSC